MHEFAHAYVAYKCGDPTAKAMGRMTLNPIKHLDLIGFLMMLMVGFGYAKAVPINPYNFRNRRKGYFLTAIAGVTVNLGLALIMSLPCFFYLVFAGEFLATNFGYFFNCILFYFITINLSLMFFNMLPIFPLDGFRVVETFTQPNNRFRTFMTHNGPHILLVLILFSTFITALCEYVKAVPPWIMYFDIFHCVRSLVEIITDGLLNFWSLIFRFLV